MTSNELVVEICIGLPEGTFETADVIAKSREHVARLEADISSAVKPCEVRIATKVVKRRPDVIKPAKAAG